MNMSFKKQPLKILIQVAPELEDMVLALPVIEMLTQQYPHCLIDVLASPRNKEIGQQHPLIRHVHVSDLATTFKAAKLWTTIRAVKSREYDLFLSLEEQLVFSWIGWVAGVPRRIGGKKNILTGWLYTDKITTPYRLLQHQIDQNLGVLAPLKIPKLTAKIRYYTDPIITKKMKRMVTGYFANNKPIVAIYYEKNSSKTTLPESAILEFIKINQADQRFNIILMGQSEEYQAIFNIQDPLTVNVMNRTQIQEIESLIQLSDYYIGSESGASQIASFLNMPMVLFIPKKSTRPSKIGPKSSSFSIIRKDYNCPFLCRSKCHPEHCFSFLTGSLIKQHLGDVMMRIESNNRLSFSDGQDYLNIQAIRILVVSNSNQEKSAKYDKLERVFFVRETEVDTFSPHNIKHIMQLILRYNITIIHGNIPNWVQFWIKWLLKRRRWHTNPQFSDIPFTSFVSSSDYIKLYRDVLKL